MARLYRKKRHSRIKINAQRRVKAKKLKEKYLATKSASEKEKILERLQKISPEYPVNQLFRS